MKLTRLLSVEFLQGIQDDFQSLTGLFIDIYDKDGTKVTELNNLPDFCRMIRQTDVGRGICRCSVDNKVRRLDEGARFETCQAGLHHCVAPIIFEGAPIGFVVLSSILLERPFKAREIDCLAGRIGADASKLYETASRLTPVPKERLDGALNFLTTIATYLARQGGITERYKELNSALKFRERVAVLSDKTSGIFNSSTDINETFKGVAELVSREIGDTCAILRVEKGRLLPITSFRKGNEDRDRFKLLADNPVPVDDGVIGSCVKGKKAVFMSDVAGDRRFMSVFTQSADVRSCICVPLIVRDEVLGVLSTSVISEGRRFNNNDLTLVTTVANRAAAALENSKLYDEARALNKRLSVVNEISRAVNSSLDLENVYATIIDQLKQVLRFPFIMNIAIYRSQDDSFLFTRLYDPIGGFEQVLKTNQPYPGDSLALTKAYKTRSTLYVPDVRKEPFSPKFQIRNHMEERGALSSIYLPLIVEQECIGILTIGTFTVDAFTKDEMALLETVSSHLAIAIKNAQNYEGLLKSNREMAFMNNIMDLLNKPSDITGLLKEVLHKALDFMGLSHGIIHLLNEAGEELRCLVHSSLDEDHLGKIRVLSVKDCLLGNVVQTGRPEYGSDLSNHPRAIETPEIEEGGYRSFATVPIQSKEKTLGVLTVATTREDAKITEDDVRLLQFLGVQVGVALENSKLHRQLAQAEKLSAIGELVSGVAHELNNPLSVILGRAQMLLMAEDEGNEQDCKAIIRSVGRCRTITNNLLSFAREVASEKKPASVNDSIQRVVSILSYHLATNNIEVELGLDGELPETMVDRNQIEQVFLNIINNAQHAIMEKCVQGKIFIGTNRVEGQIIILFTDNGKGMDKATVNRAFDPFFTTKEIGKGTGLGLSVSLGIIRSHNGNIKLNSRPGVGTEVLITLPVTETDPVEDRAGISDDTEETLPAGKRALIVDDEEEILTIYCKLFSKYGWDTIIALDGNEALSHISEREFDIILCDLKMPGMDGKELYEVLKREHPSTLSKLIFSTGDMANMDTELFLRATGAVYVSKPVDLSELTRALFAILSDNDPVPAADSEVRRIYAEQALENYSRDKKIRNCKDG